MAVFNLYLRFNNKLHSFSLNSRMSFSDIKRTVANSFCMNTDMFDIQVYNERLKDNLTFDDEYVEILDEELPRTSISTLHGDILLNSSSIGSCIFDQCNMVAEANDSNLNPLSVSDAINNEDSISRNYTWTYDEGNRRAIEYLQILPATEPKEEKPPICQSEESYCFIPTSEPTMTSTDDIDSLITNDEIDRTICPNDVFRLDNNELQVINVIDYEAEVTVKSLVDIVVSKPVDVATNQVEPSCTIQSENFSDYLLPHHSSQFVQQEPFEKELSSLTFVRDVQSYQKIQYDTDDLDECLDKNCQPYVIRIQGSKTDIEKEKNILPELKLPYGCILLYRERKQPLSLMVATVHESKVNDKRILYACNDRQFLPNGKNKITDAVNPIQLDLYTLSIAADGIFKLSLRLISDSSQSKEKENNKKRFCELDEEIAANLHPTPYDPQHFRIACTLVKDDSIAWDTLCLSDYIRPKQRLQT